MKTRRLSTIYFPTLAAFPLSVIPAQVTKFLLAFFIILIVSNNCIYLQTLKDPEELKKVPEDKKTYAIRVVKPTEDPKEINAELKKIYGNKIYFINNIYIKNQKISDKDDFILDFINFFHWTTEEYIILQEMLYERKDDNITSFELLQESERNLRATGLFKKAHVYYYPIDLENPPSEEFLTNLKTLQKKYEYMRFPDEEDLEEVPKKELVPVNIGIETRDRNTSTVAMQLSGAGGNATYHLSAGERNLLGRRYIVNGSYTWTNMLNKVGQKFGKLRLLGSRWNIIEETRHHYYKGEWVRHEAIVALNKPFYSLRTPWSYYFSVAASDGQIVQFVEGEEEQLPYSIGGKEYSAIQDRRDRKYYGEVSRAWGVTEKFIISLGSGQSVEQYQYHYKTPSVFDALLYKDENNHFVISSLQVKTYSYLKTTNFKRFIFEEDIRLGLDSYITVRQTLPVLGLPDKFTRITEGVSWSNSFKKSFFYAVSASNTNQYDHIVTRWQNNITGTGAAIFWGFNPIGYFANRANFYFGKRLFNQDVFENAGENIRGLGARIYRGNRKLVINSEFRTKYVRIPYIPYVVVGFVVFNDWGDVWYDNWEGIPTWLQDHRTFQFRGTVGAGFRIAPIDIQDNMFRIDIGFPVTKDDMKGFKLFTNISFGMDHLF
jgi:hypothetical protein